MGSALLLLLALAAAPDAAPSVAVLRLQGGADVAADAVDLLTGTLATRVREQRCFGSVITMQQVETLLGLEKQRQLLDCGTESCVAEVAGALGVEYVVTGGVGRLGEAFVFNLALINTRTARVEGAATHKAAGRDPSVLVDALDGMIGTLLHDVRGTVCPKTMPAAVAAPPSTPAAASEVPTETPAPRVLRGAGIFAGLGAVGAVVLGGIGAVAATALLVVLRLQPDRYVGTGLGRPLSTVVVLGWSALAVAVPLGLLGMAVALGLGGASMVVE